MRNAIRRTAGIGFAGAAVLVLGYAAGPPQRPARPLRPGELHKLGPHDHVLPGGDPGHGEGEPVRGQPPAPSPDHARVIGSRVMTVTFPRRGHDVRLSRRCEVRPSRAGMV
jgi:hypothetical protein